MASGIHGAINSSEQIRDVISMKKEVNDLQGDPHHDFGLIKAINRFRFQLLPTEQALAHGTLGPSHWTVAIGSGENAGEEVLISECRTMEYHVRRALASIRFDNNGYMKNVSLLQIIGNSVATTMFCRLVKIIHTECRFISGLLYPSGSKVEENDSECQSVLPKLRSYKPSDLQCDIDGTAADESTFTLSNDLVMQDREFPQHLAVDRFIDMVMQAMGRYSVSQRSMYPLNRADMLLLYNRESIGKWRMLPGTSSGVTDTATQIQEVSKEMGFIVSTGTNESIVKRLCRHSTLYVLFVEACAMKCTVNVLKISNGGQQRREMLFRALNAWHANIEYIVVTLGHTIQS